MQYAINKINDIFAKDSDLGATGEVFLVNKEAYMLTDSKFSAKSTILSQHLSHENINTKFEEGEGHKVVTDYRNKKAVTSFKVVPILDSKWLLIAKIDRDEIISEKYKRDSDETWKELLKTVELKDKVYKEDNFKFDKRIEVDMDEFKRAASDEILYTHGVSYCTTVIISLEGEFAYMGHISAYDKMYGGSQTDILGRMLKRIDKFDLIDFKKRDVKISIISPNIMFSKNIIKDLLNWGVMLSQIKIATNNKSKYVNVTHDYPTGTTHLEWFYKGRSKPLKSSMEDIENLCKIYENMPKYLNN
jgi:hypothetical protein